MVCVGWWFVGLVVGLVGGLLVGGLVGLCWLDLVVFVGLLVGFDLEEKQGVCR